MIPFALKNTIEHQIGVAVVEHTMESTVGYEHNTTGLNLKWLAVFVAHDHQAVALYKEVYLLLTRMSMTPGLLPRIKASGAQNQILQCVVVSEQVGLVVFDHLATNVLLLV